MQLDWPVLLDHMICVDGCQKVVWNNSESQYLIKLNAGLNLCSGVRWTKNVEVRVLELLEKRVNKVQKSVEAVNLEYNL